MPKISLDAVARWLVIILPVSMIIAPAGVEVPVALVGLMFLYRSFRMKDWAWLRYDWVRILSVLWVYLLVRSLFAEHMDDALSRSASWVRYPIFAIALVHWVLKDALTQQRLLKVLIGATVFYVADAIFQYFVGVDVFGYKQMPYGSGEVMRLTGPFGETRVGIITTWLIFPALLYVASLRTQNRAWVFAAVAFILGYLAAVYVSGERMALLLGIMGVTISFIFVRVARLPIFIGALCGVAAMLAINAAQPNMADRQIDQSRTEIAGYTQSAYGQLVISALNIWKENPLFGVGLKHFRSACPDAKYGDTSKKALYMRCSLHPHNMYAEWLAEAGGVGMLLMLATIAVWFSATLRHFRLTVTDPVLAGITIGVIIKLWPLAATSSFFVGWSAVPFWLFVGWMLARQQLLGSQSS